jgi:nucleolar protein 6
MSEDQPSSRAEKKVQRDADRKKSGKKRKHAEVEQQDEGKQTTNELQADFIPLDVRDDVAKEAKVKSKSSSKKRKAKDVQANGEDVADAADTAPDTSAPKPKKRKKQKQATTEGGEGDATTSPTNNTTKSRFVCFIGNLPYATTDESLRAHFKKLTPFRVRHRTDPETKKSKGFAFLEFENYDRMKTCLKLYHHSMFDPASTKGASEAEDGTDAGKENMSKSKAKGARRINVELTAGGGGKNDERKQKIQAKNVRLNEQRQRRAEFERLEREKGEGEGKAAGAKKASQKRDEDATKDETAGMHPSRLARLKA